ncbi:protein Dok-7-like [Cyprinus carpio]|uniref:Protein Dok-7-like n=1 Tax=Cyprinus carpio TaxID=7962 RepID=A0A9Q9Y8T1_CYPCA|nr:protein Dok-7-like [Cyprinus carpio]
MLGSLGLCQEGGWPNACVSYVGEREFVRVTAVQTVLVVILKRDKSEFEREKRWLKATQTTFTVSLIIILKTRIFVCLHIRTVFLFVVLFPRVYSGKTDGLILRKPSPVADCLSLLVYKGRGEKSKGQRERSQATLRDICGLEALQGFDGVNYVLSLLCLSQSVMLGFDNKASLLAWDARIRYSLGEVHRFNIIMSSLAPN